MSEAQHGERIALVDISPRFDACVTYDPATAEYTFTLDVGAEV